MKRRVALSILVLLALVLCSILPVHAIETGTEGYYSYSVFNNQATITDCSSTISGNIVIPSTLGGYPVTRIGKDAFYRCSSLQNITIPAGVTSIGNSAFSGCSSLQNITIPEGVTSIGHSAFVNCSNLTAVTIPGSVTYIGENVFNNCKSLTAVTIPEGVTGIGNSMFFGCSSLTSVTIPASVASIGNSVFSDCSSLQSITIPASVTSIGYYAFYNCSSLQSITIPEGVTAIEGFAFFGCSSLTDITIPAGLTGISNSMFSGCSSLTSVTIPAGVTSIGDSAFSGCSSLTSVTIPESVISIDESAFSGCAGLTQILVEDGNPNYSSDENGVLFNQNKTVLISVPNGKNGHYTVPDGVVSIGAYAFYHCSSLTSVTIPERVTIIGDYAFSGCGSLTGITISNGVTDIGDYAFAYCSSLIDITIPDSVTCIGTGAFSGCRNLQSMTIPFVGDSRKTALDTYQYPFGYIFGNTSYTGGVATKQYYYGADTTKATYYTYYIPESLRTVTVTGGNILYGAFYNCMKLTSITIPDGITDIGDYAFYYCDNLPSFTIPDSVTGIGNHAFDWCWNLTGIIIPDGVASIGDYAFDECRSLTGIVIPDSVTSIGDYAFFRCNGLTSATIGNGVTEIGKYAFGDCSVLASATLGNSVTQIGESAFRYCGLTSIAIPDSVTSIGSYAFHWCSSLTEISVKDGNPNYSSDARGVLFDKDKTLLITAPGAISGSYTIPDGVTVIGDCAFNDCGDLTGIIIPVSVTDIGIYAFYQCNCLTSVIIDDSPVNIGDYAFYGCNRLSDLTLGNSVAGIGNYAFMCCSSLGDITLPETVAGIGSGAFQYCSSMTRISVKENNPNYSSDTRGVLFNKDKTTLLEAPGGISGAYIIPDSVTGIGFEAFKHCENLTGIVIPDSVTGVGNYAFEECRSLTAASFGNSVSSIGYGAFKYCVLNHVTYAGTQTQWGKVTIKTGNGQLTDASTFHYETAFDAVDTCTESSIYCSLCQELLSQTLKPDGAHTFVEATCSTPKTCKVCQITEGKALGHNYVSVVTAPTCTEDGYTTKTCSICADVVVTDCVAATGHGWSEWNQTAAPSCTAEGTRLRFCNCGSNETEVIAKLPHNYESDLCTGCGAAAQYELVLTEDTAVNWGLTQDLYVDLAGFDLTGTIITNGFKVYGMDSTTDSYSCEKIGYFTCVDESGNFIAPERICVKGEKQYMTICTEDRYSFHRFFVGVTHMSLEPEVIGLGYKAAVCGDEMVFAQLAETNAFSFKLQLEGYDPVYRHYDSNELTSGEPITLRIRNYDVENYSEHNLYARVSLTLNDGTVVEAKQVALTFRWLTEQVNANYTDYTAEQITQFAAMLQKFDVVKKWDIPNLL